MTAYGDDDAIRAEAKRLGVKSFFDKPFDLDDLRNAVVKSLVGRRATHDF
jgi:DNA-binding NtrC family response regulator